MNVKRALIGLSLAGAASFALVNPASSAPKNNDAVEIAVADGVYGGTTAAIVSPMTNDPAARLASEYWVRAACHQNGVVVYEQHVKTSGGVAVFTLGPTPMWSGGGADCVAEVGFLRGGKWVASTSTTFVTVS